MSFDDLICQGRVTEFNYRRPVGTLVSGDNRPMKLLNHDTRHLSRHDSDDKKIADDEDADAFMLLYFLTAKQHKKRTHKSGPYGSAVGYSTGK